MNDTRKLVGLAKLRREQGLSQHELATKANMLQQAISDYEVGKKEPTLNTACRLAEALGVSVDQVAQALREQKEQVTAQTG